MEIPHFVIKNKFQKRSDLYENILTRIILLDVSERITGVRNYTVTFDNDGYNKGRLATLEYNGNISYISFSEVEVTSRNSSFQSFSTALVKYHQESNDNKSLYFYFLETNGRIATAYFIFMYRLMKTAGTIFLNEQDFLNLEIIPFNSAADIIAQRNFNRERNSGNSSTYVTFDENNILQIYGKTYGANKYETTLLCIAFNQIAHYPIELYEIKEGNLKNLPEPARGVIISLGITVITSDIKFERNEFETNDSFRSPKYIYNLFEKLGEKKCSLCNCEIPQIIQGAHIWPVSDIKKQNNLTSDEKLAFALDGENGLWLCQNHHRMFDVNMLKITKHGLVKFKSNLGIASLDFINEITTVKQIPLELVTSKFINFLSKRNKVIDEINYAEVV